MGFDRSQWFDKIKDCLRDLAVRTGESLNVLGATTVWGGLMAAVVLPVLEAASRQPEKVQEILAATLAGVGGNLLANLIQRWKDSATPAEDVVRELEQAVLAQPDLAKEVEEIFQNLKSLGIPVLSTFREADTKAGGQALDRLLRELEAHHRAGRFRSLWVDAGGDVAMDQARITKIEHSPGAIVANHVTVLRPSSEQPEPNLSELHRTYLQDLVTRYEWLDFSGIPQVRNIVRLRLDDIFVPLSTTKEMPKGDTLAEVVGLRRPKGRAATN